ncbi:hypothetical protein Tco_0858174 [Tanacetum coccineum]|uniref:Uncharacterized protein n=1 Tax=Tanacetum coccineum TaxID=301880 RepID=A0ABQ5BAK0_9ASTR
MVSTLVSLGVRGVGVLADVLIKLNGNPGEKVMVCNRGKLLRERDWGRILTSYGGMLTERFLGFDDGQLTKWELRGCAKLLANERATSVLDYSESLVERLQVVLTGRVWAGFDILRFDHVRFMEGYARISKPSPKPNGTFGDYHVFHCFPPNNFVSAILVRVVPVLQGNRDSQVPYELIKVVKNGYSGRHARSEECKSSCFTYRSCFRGRLSPYFIPASLSIILAAADYPARDTPRETVEGIL